MKALEKRIAARLLSSGIVTDSQLEEALTAYTGEEPLHKLLVRRGLISPRDACRAAAEASGLQFIDLESVVSQPAALASISAQQAWQHRILPIWQDETSLTLAMEDTTNLVLIDDLRVRLRLALVTLVAEAEDLRRALIRYYGPNPADRPPRSSREVPRLVISETGASESVATEPVSETNRTVHSTSTRLDLPKMNVNTVIEELRRKSGSGEISHREFQRRVRELRETENPNTNDSRGISSAATRFEESSQATLAEVEAGRMKRGAYEPPTDSARVDRADGEPAPAPVSTLKRLLDHAVEEEAHEIELTPTELDPRVRIRKGGVWVPVSGYPIDQHNPIIGRLRLMAGLELKPKTIANEHQFLLPTRKGQLLCTLFLEKTAFGDRAVVRLGEGSPLMRDPLGFLALPSEEMTRIGDRLNARAGGLLLVSSPSPRTLSTVYHSFLAHLGRSGQRDILSLERPNERRLPGVTPINCPSEDILLASLANAAFMNPDVLGVQSIENGSVLNRVINMAMRGTTTIGCFTAPDPATALACLSSARADAMNILRGVLGLLHVVELPRLCPECRTTIGDPDTLPDWARAIEAPWFQPAACPKCSQTGFLGNVWAIEYWRPSLERKDGSFDKVVPLSRDLLALALAGEIDPRSFPYIVQG